MLSILLLEVVISTASGGINPFSLIRHGIAQGVVTNLEGKFGSHLPRHHEKGRYEPGVEFLIGFGITKGVVANPA